MEDPVYNFFCIYYIYGLINKTSLLINQTPCKFFDSLDVRFCFVQREFVLRKWLYLITIVQKCIYKQCTEKNKWFDCGFSRVFCTSILHLAIHSYIFHFVRFFSEHILQEKFFCKCFLISSMHWISFFWKNCDF